MKILFKKSFLLLLVVLIAPIFLLVGCGEVQTYNITATTNCQNGNVTGMGRYDEGSKVTLTAKGVNNNKFIAWVYQNKTILISDNAYTIETSADNMTSTLSFTASSYTSDNYTAIFEDARQMYYTVSSYRVVEHAENTDIPEEDIENQDITCTGALSISIGENALSYRDVINLTNYSFLNTTTAFADVRDVFSFNNQTPYYIKFAFSSGNFKTSKTISLTYGKSGEQDDVDIKFKTDGDIVLTYTFDMNEKEIEETPSEDTQSEETPSEKILTTLILTLCPLRVNI